MLLPFLVPLKPRTHLDKGLSAKVAFFQHLFQGVHSISLQIVAINKNMMLSGVRSRETVFLWASRKVHYMLLLGNSPCQLFLNEGQENQQKPMGLRGEELTLKSPTCIFFCHCRCHISWPEFGSKELCMYQQIRKFSPKSFYEVLLMAKY